ncbi:MAG: TonB-dependent receptor, partial [Oligoflexia bacterium]|nr:TonB-dependent receptor [Oligoflexia bacterium]
SQFILRSSLGTAFEAPGLIELYTPAKKTDIWVDDTVACYNQLKSDNHFKPIYDSLTGEKFKSQEDKDKLIKEFLIEQSSVAENQSLSDNTKSAFKGLAKPMADSKYCNKWVRVPGTFQGNKNLKPMKALTASLGFHWDMNEDHGLTVDAWFNSLNGAISWAFNDKTIDAELRYGKKYVEEVGLQYERDSTAPYPIVNPVDSFINVSARKLYGVNLSWKSNFSNWKFGGGNFYFEDDFSYVIKAGVENFKGMGFVNNLGKSLPGGYSLPKWRNFSALGWKNSKHNISLILKSVASVKKRFDESKTLPTGHVVDLFYKYNMNPKTTLRFGWYNLLFSDPVLDDSIQRGIKFNSHFFDPRGPHFFVELRQKI